MQTTQDIIEDIRISLIRHKCDKERDFTKKWYSEEDIKKGYILLLEYVNTKAGLLELQKWFLEKMGDEE